MNAPHIASVEEKNLHLTEDEERVVTPSIDEETFVIPKFLKFLKNIPISVLAFAVVSPASKVAVAVFRPFKKMKTRLTVLLVVRSDFLKFDQKNSEFSHDGDDKDRPNIDRNRSFGSSLASLSIASFFGLGNDGKASRTALNNFDKEKAIETIHEV